MNDHIEVRDEIARMTGYTTKVVPNTTGLGASESTFWRNPDGTPFSNYFNGHQDHPIPNTLEEAAKLPDGYSSTVICTPAWANAPGKRWTVTWRMEEGSRQIFAGSEVSELEARFALRLAVLKHMAAQETKQ